MSPWEKETHFFRSCYSLGTGSYSLPRQCSPAKTRTTWSMESRMTPALPIKNHQLWGSGKNDAGGVLRGLSTGQFWKIENEFEFDDYTTLRGCKLTSISIKIYVLLKGLIFNVGNEHKFELDLLNSIFCYYLLCLNKDMFESVPPWLPKNFGCKQLITFSVLPFRDHKRERDSFCSWTEWSW